MYSCLLYDSLLLDWSATIHVCNNFSRISNFTLTTTKVTLYASFKMIYIDELDTVAITYKLDSDNMSNIKLQDVTYKVSCHTSVVSLL
jgi:hypothetical protein